MASPALISDIQKVEASTPDIFHGTFLMYVNVEEGDQGMVRPSRAFCKAIDNEQEFDANDVLASGMVGQSGDTERPSQSTQVRPVTTLSQEASIGHTQLYYTSLVKKYQKV